MSTYIPKRKGENGEMEEIKFPWAVLANPPTIPSKTSQLTNDSGFTANKGTVTSVTINGVNKTPNSAGLVDLGTISGGGGSGAKTYSDYIYADDVTTIFENNEYGNAFILAKADVAQGVTLTLKIICNSETTPLITATADSTGDDTVSMIMSRFGSTIVVTVLYKNTIKTVYKSTGSAPSSVDLYYTDDENQTSTVDLLITKGVE